jgi:pyruvate dehydrogenase E1 component beta subunit
MLMNFTTVAMDMIVNHAAKLRFMSGGQTHVPIVIRTMTGSGFANGGQHSDYLEGWFAHTAGMKVVCPSSPAYAYGLMRSAIDDPDPVLFIENLLSYTLQGPLPEPGLRVPIGKGRIVQAGRDITIVTYARMVQESEKAAVALAAEGIAAEVIDLRSIQPWDRDLVLSSVRRTGRALVVHEAALPFGPAGEISSTIHEALFHSLKGPVGRMGGAFCAVPFSRPLEAAFAPHAETIAGKVRDMLASEG